jgi:putative ABC transport system substrate-binding protein
MADRGTGAAPVMPIVGFINSGSADGYAHQLVAFRQGLKEAGYVEGQNVSAFMVTHRAAIISAAARNNVPAVYAQSAFARDGGLLSYGVDREDTFRRGAIYVDRILRGEKPGDLPVQLPTKFEMVVNLMTAKALGVAVPPSILLRGDEQIE